MLQRLFSRSSSAPDTGAPWTLGAPGTAAALCLATGLALTLVSPTPAAADILVMKDGSKVETKGAWEVKGRQVLFTLPNGTLSALRLSEIDLDASAAATEAWKNPPAPAAPGAASAATEDKPVLVLTNDDIAAGTVTGLDAGDDEATGEEQNTGSVAVAEWSYDPGSGDAAYTLTGRLENQTGVTVEQVQVYVDIIATDAGTPRPNSHILRQARVVQERLEPDETTDFSYNVTIRDLEYALAPAEQFESPRVTFDVQFRRSTRGAAADGDDAGADDDFDGDDVDGDDDIGAGSDDLEEGV